MKVMFIQDYEGHKKGDVLTHSEDEFIRGLLDKKIIKVIPKQIKPYSNKMITNYMNKG